MRISNIKWLENRLNSICSVDGESGDGGGASDPGPGPGVGDPGSGQDPGTVDPGGQAPAGEAGEPSAGGDRPTILNDGGAGDPPPKPQSYPDDWRSKMVNSLGVEGSDKDKLMTRMDRFTDPSSVLKSMLEFEGVIKKKQGDWAPKLADNATDEQLSEYREAKGVPQTTEGYLTGIPEGLVLSDADKTIAQSFFEHAHSKNMSQEDVNTALEWHRQLQERTEIGRQELDSKSYQETEEALRSEWGGEYKSNINMIGAMLNTFSPESKEAIENGFSPDGTSLMNNTHVLRDLARTARENNPVGIVIDGNIPTDMSSIDQRLAVYDKQMRQNRPEWNKNASGQKEYQQLLEQKDRLASRSAA